MGDGISDVAGHGKQAALMAAGKSATHKKWPAQVRTMRKGVMQGYRQLVMPTCRFRMNWRSLKGHGFWVTAKNSPVFEGKTLGEATLKLAEWYGL